MHEKTGKNAATRAKNLVIKRPHRHTFAYSLESPEHKEIKAPLKSKQNRIKRLLSTSTRMNDSAWKWLVQRVTARGATQYTILLITPVDSIPIPYTTTKMYIITSPRCSRFKMFEIQQSGAFLYYLKARASC